MPQNPRPTTTTTILDSLGEEIVRIVTPVSICMFTVVALVSLLSSESTPTRSSIATVAYSETTSDSIWDKLAGALLNSLVFVAVVTAVTFLLVLLFYLGCTRFLKYYMGFSAFTVLCFLGGETALFVLQDFSVPIDCVTFSLGLFNFAVVGLLAVFMSKVSIFVTQSYLVVIGVLVAYWFTLLPEWTTWALLVAMALYDLAAVLLPVGPLRLLVELAISRDEDIPALVYEARPVARDNSPGAPRRVWRGGERRVEDSSANSGAESVFSGGIGNPNVAPDASSAAPLLDRGGERGVEDSSAESVFPGGIGNPNVASDASLAAPLLDRGGERRVEDSSTELVFSGGIANPDVASDASRGGGESVFVEGMGLGSSGAIKLGLGDFIFYSVLVGRAAMYDMTTVYSCYLAIVAGLGVTLMLLALYQKALPALPVSVMLGVLFYFMTRFVLEIFLVQCALNLLMF